MAATLLCWLLDTRMSIAGLVMVYLVAVVAMATLLNRAAGVFASLMCVTALNFFFVPPRYSFEIDGAEYWWTLAVMLGVSIGLNLLIGSLRAGRADAEHSEARAAQLHQLAQLLAACEGAEAGAKQSAHWLCDKLGHSCAVFIRAAPDQPLACYSPIASERFQPRAVEWAMEQGRCAGRGCPDWPDLSVWTAPFGRRQSMGGIQVLLAPAERPAPETLGHWQALVQQVGLSVERASAAAAAREAQEQAQAEATRNTLLASLSHDLRTPLAAIVGSASALRMQGEAMGSAARAQLLANLENEARDMTLMADNILQMARLAQPRWQLATQWEAVEELLDTAVQRTRRRWQGAHITARAPSGLPLVQAEAGLLAQVLANLIDNALRHAGTQTEVVIQAGRTRDGVFIAVRDRGPGLGECDENLLFDRFRRTAAGPTAGGAGLGLAICKTIVLAHGGRIQVQRCTPGTEFRIDLPATAPQALP